MFVLYKPFETCFGYNVACFVLKCCYNKMYRNKNTNIYLVSGTTHLRKFPYNIAQFTIE